MRRRFFDKEVIYNDPSIEEVYFDYKDYMTIEILDSDCVIKFEKKLIYGINGQGWSYVDGSKEFGYYISAKKGDFISLKYNLAEGEQFGTINIPSRFNLRGNCLSLIFSDDAKYNTNIELYPSVFYCTFKDGLVVYVEDSFLPATILSPHCYERMFYGCTSLTTAPELPATTLADYCYEYMFYNCYNITSAPELPATTLTEYCYYNMFADCSSLKYIKMLATDISAYNCLTNWVKDVHYGSAGTFVKSKDATWDVRGNSGIPSSWTVITDEEESGKLKNTGRISISMLKSSYIEWDYPVASEVSVIFQGNHAGQTILNTVVGSSRSFQSITPGPGETFTVSSIEPTEDDAYVYELVVTNNI